MSEDVEDEGIAIYMTRADAFKAADLLDLSDDEEADEIAATIRFQAKYNRELPAETKG